jgi:conjugal transfer pilin signal peptidase TrbI
MIKIMEFLRNYKKRIGALVILVAALLALHGQLRIIYLRTPSLPYKLCLHLRKIEPRRGDLCVFRRNGVTIVKYLLGLEGDGVGNINNQIYVNSRYVGTARKTNLLTPVENGVIPRGYAFVAGTHLDSFDSRYQEFGLVKISEIEGKALGIWK